MEKYRQPGAARQLASFLPYMYLGSSLPLISQWKQEHPKAFNDVTLGLIFLILASGGGIAALLGT